MKIERFEDMQAWQAARELTRLVYTLSSLGAFSHDFGLRDQIRRAATSVMANIAEGFDADTDNEFCRFPGFARRSTTEVQSHCYTALDQNYLTLEEFNQIYAKARDAKGLIGGIVRYLRANPRRRKMSPPPPSTP